MTPEPTLRERAGIVLAYGPCHTLELARRVLGLSGNDAAAAAAVFTLLGGDARFRVDASGTWRIDENGEAPGTPLRRVAWAVVDVETTGGSVSQGHRVTEVAVVEVRDGQVGEGFHTLVNPGRPIPPRIQGLTGITDEMVAEAPPFEGIAGELERRLRGRVFVAHNVHFDWGFLRGEFLAASGEVPAMERLCTVRTGRALVPGLRSYALDALAHHFRIPNHARHRAWGDAVATARILVHLLDEAERRGAADLGGLERLLAERGKHGAGRGRGGPDRRAPER